MRRQGVVTPSGGAQQRFRSTPRAQFEGEARPDEDVAETCGQRLGEEQKERWPSVKRAGQLARRTAIPRARAKVSWKRSSMPAGFV